MARVYRTARADKELEDIIFSSIEDYGIEVATGYREDIRKTQERLMRNPRLGKLDPVHHSDHYYYIQINSHKLIYEIIEEDVFIVTVQWAGRDFKALLHDLEPQFQKDIQVLKNRLKKTS